MAGKVVIEIRTDNAAFDPEPGPEIARILRNLADKVGTFNHVVLFDINGNVVGSYTDDAAGNSGEIHN